MPWMKVSLNVAQDQLNLIEELLLAHEAQSLTVSSLGEETSLEHTLHELPKWPHARVEVLFALHDDIQSIVKDVQTIGVNAVDISFVGDEDWKHHKGVQLKPMDFGGLWVVPRSAPTSELKNVVRIGPGLAFGTGAHSTTSMCLSWLAKHPPQNMNVLDFGTGSGILSIAAKKLGAGTVDAIDIDPLARETAHQNARYNDVEVFVAEEIPAGRSFDLILVNILLNTILQYAPTLNTSLRPGGTILLTGLLPNQIDQVESAYPTIEFIEIVSQKEWRMMIGISQPTSIRANV